MLRQPIVCVLGHVDHGKCVHGDTRIVLADGRITRARELYDSFESQGRTIPIEDGVFVEVGNGPVLLAFDGNGFVPKRATHVWRRKAGKLVELRLSNGDVLRVTPEHPLLSVADFNIDFKRADALHCGDAVLCPSMVPLQASTDWKREILLKMEQTGNWIVFLDERKAGGFLAKLGKDNKSALRRDGLISTGICRNRFRARDFLSLCRKYGVPLEQAYGLISGFKHATEKWRATHKSLVLRLPQESALHEFGYALGCWAGDGSMAASKLHNNDADVQLAFEGAVRTVFGIESRTAFGHTCWEVVPKGGATLRRFLTEIMGIPRREKSGNVEIPLLCQKVPDAFTGFIEGWFDTDGYVSPLNHCIEFTTKSEQLARQACIHLGLRGIQSVFYKKNGYSTVRIANEPNLARFLEFASPHLLRRVQRAREASLKSSSSRLFDVFPVSRQERIALSAALPGKINRKLPYFNQYLNRENWSRHVALQVASQVCKPNGQTALLAQFLQLPLASVSIVGARIVENDSQWVYDFTIPEFHNYLAERIVAHNTSLLDAIRHSRVQKREAGAITQHIGASEVPADAIAAVCGALLARMKISLTVPGLLFIDTPGHEAFVNLRRRGGSIADIAVLVIDINQGIQPQTKEAIEILREYKTPFVVAATKVDVVTGWVAKQTASVGESIAKQRPDVSARLDEMCYRLVGSLSQYGFSSERFDRVSDFTKQIAIIPVSAKTGEGLAELLVFVSGLAQKFMESQLKPVDGPAKASILEVKDEKGVGKTLDAILYEGTLFQGDGIVFCSAGGEIVHSKVKAILKPKPLDEMRDPRQKFTEVAAVSAAAGVKIACEGAELALAGSSLYAVNDGNSASAEEELKKEVRGIEFSGEANGAILKADALGSLEAIVKLLSAEKVPVRRASVGRVTKKDVLEAASVARQDLFLGVVFAFNVPAEQDALAYAAEEKVKIFEEKIIYSLIENYKSWRQEAREGERKAAFSTLPLPCKLLVLEKHCFRASNPCVFGVEILAGRLRKGAAMMNGKGEAVGEVKSIQRDKESVDEAKRGDAVAISMDEPYYGRQVRGRMELFSDISRGEVKLLEEKYQQALGEDEKELLAEIKRIKGFQAYAF